MREAILTQARRRFQRIPDLAASVSLVTKEPEAYVRMEILRLVENEVLEVGLDDYLVRVKEPQP